METSTPDRRRIRVRAALAGVLGAAALTAGAGVAYAASTGNEVVETGYATVVESDPAGSATVVEPSSAGTAYDCPEDGATGEAAQ